MVLLNDVVELFDLAERNAGIMFGFMLRVVAFDHRRVGTALVDRWARRRLRAHPPSAASGYLQGAKTVRRVNCKLSG